MEDFTITKTILFYTASGMLVFCLLLIPFAFGLAIYRHYKEKHEYRDRPEEYAALVKKRNKAALREMHRKLRNETQLW